MCTCTRYNGMHRFSARYEVIKELTAKGLYKGSRPNPGMRLGLSSRTKDVIEPVLKPQWYVDLITFIHMHVLNFLNVMVYVTTMALNLCV
jgi:valyl-tRNA synthetase